MKAATPTRVTKHHPYHTTHHTTHTMKLCTISKLVDLTFCVDLE